MNAEAERADDVRDKMLRLSGKRTELLDLPATYEETLELFHHGEALGEALFLDAMRTENDPTARLKLAHLAQVETENKAWFRGPLVAAGRSIDEPPELREVARTIADANFRGAWDDIVRRMHERMVKTHLPQFESYLSAARTRGDPREIRACERMLAHEVAFAEFTRRDIEGAPLDEVLAPLRDFLRFKLDEDAAA